MRCIGNLRGKMGGEAGRDESGTLRASCTCPHAINSCACVESIKKTILVLNHSKKLILVRSMRLRARFAPV